MNWFGRTFLLCHRLCPPGRVRSVHYDSISDEWIIDEGIGIN